MEPDRFLCATLRDAPWGAAVARVLAAAVAAVEPGAAVRQQLERTNTTLRVGSRAYDLARYERVYVVGAGKAGAPMAHAAAAVLGPHCSGGIVVVKDGHTATPLPASLVLHEAGHPVPDQRGVAGTQQIAGLLRAATDRDLVLVLLSGGGSALLTLPVSGVSLADMQALTATLLHCGATINEINTLRKHLDQVKGGGLARMAAPAAIATLVLSDVVGSPLDVIASGPTVPDSSTFADAWAVVEQYGIAEQLPAAIRQHLEAGVVGQHPETLKPGDPVFEHGEHVIVGSNHQAAEAALQQARQEGMHGMLLSTFLQGEAREVGRVLGAVGRELAAHGQPMPRPACVVAGGETTVTMRGDGRGGRNQELALAAVADLAGLPGIIMVTLATDGGDGPTDAAGAVVSGTTWERARALGHDPAAFLRRNDAYTFFDALGDLLRPGPTATNVNDLAFVFALPAGGTR